MSLHFPQANGAVENAEKIAKRTLTQPDIFVALMAYNSTPVTATGVKPSRTFDGQENENNLTQSFKQT